MQSPRATGALLKVHTSNYRIVGFASDVAPAELVGLGAGVEGSIRVRCRFGPARRSGAVAGRSAAQLDRERAGNQAVDPSRCRPCTLFRRQALRWSASGRDGRTQGSDQRADTASLSSGFSHRWAFSRRVGSDGRVVLPMGAGAEIPLWEMASRTYVELERRCGGVVEQAGIGARIEESSSVLGGGSIPGAGNSLAGDHNRRASRSGVSRLAAKSAADTCQARRRNFASGPPSSGPA